MKTLSIFFLLVFLGCQSEEGTVKVNNQPLKNVNLSRYLGTWFEIARLPNSFEKNLVCVTATYGRDSSGNIRVLNQGLKGSPAGKLKTAEGKAKLPDPAVGGALKVSFFLFFYADYFILELDEKDYQWAVVGSSSADYLWILCRNSEMDDNLYSDLVAKAKARGYDVGKLEKVPQRRPMSADK